MRGRNRVEQRSGKTASALVTSAPPLPHSTAARIPRQLRARNDRANCDRGDRRGEGVPRRSGENKAIGAIARQENRTGPLYSPNLGLKQGVRQKVRP